MALLNNARGDARYGGESAPLVVADYTISTLPAASAHTGHMIFVTDATGVGSPLAPGEVCFSNGTAWISVVTGVAVA